MDKELSVRQKETMAYMDSASSSKTVSGRADHWVANTVANRPIYSKGNPPLKGLTVFIVAAGPSLKKNAHLLKNLGRNHLIVCVDAAYRFLVKNGVTPDYCVSLDADERMITMIDGADTAKTTLVAQASASPALVKYWKGEKFFLRATGGSRDLDDKLHAAHRVVRASKTINKGETLDPLNDIVVEFAGLRDALTCGGNVTTYAHAFALTLLKAQKIVFVGADYGWETDAEFYAGGAHKELAKERQDAEKVLSHPKLGGGECFTNFTMFSFKKWHDDLAVHVAEHCVNATEGGILGVAQDGSSMGGWEHMTLAEAIEKFCPPPSRLHNLRKAVAA
jgi:hypothetical protein